MHFNVSIPTRFYYNGFEIVVIMRFLSRTSSLYGNKSTIENLLTDISQFQNKLLVTYIKLILNKTRKLYTKAIEYCCMTGNESCIREPIVVLEQ